MNCKRKTGRISTQTDFGEFSGRHSEDSDPVRNPFILNELADETSMPAGKLRGGLPGNKPEIPGKFVVPRVAQFAGDAFDLQSVKQHAPGNHDPMVTQPEFGRAIKGFLEGTLKLPHREAQVVGQPGDLEIAFQCNSGTTPGEWIKGMIRIEFELHRVLKGFFTIGAANQRNISPFSWKNGRSFRERNC